MGKTNGSDEYKMAYCRSCFEMIVEYSESPEVSAETFRRMADDIARNALEVIGSPPAMIEEKACEMATEKTRDQLEDMADLEIMRRKEDRS